jgi:CubicO group peptidase (beta-lactamase class C family)
MCLSALVGAKLLAAWVGGGSLDGVALQSRDRIVQATRVQIAGKDMITDGESAKALGFVVGEVSMGSHTAFDMRGTGGSLVFADSAIGLSFPLTKNRLGVSPWDKNSEAILVAETKSVLSLAK